MAMEEKIPVQIRLKREIDDGKGGTKIKEEILNLRTNDLPRPVTFETRYGSLLVFLVPAQQQFDPAGEKWVKVPDTEVRILFKGGKWNTRNANMMELVMKSREFSNGDIHIDQEDPTGVWRELGYIKARTVEVVDEITMIHPSYTEEILESMKKIGEPTAEKPVVPLERID